MKLYILCLIILCGSYTAVSAQPPRINNRVIKLIDSAKVALCENDTAKTIAILEHIEQLYPTDALIISTNKALAHLYIAKGNMEAAREKLIYAFTYIPTTNPLLLDRDTCLEKLRIGAYPQTKADICLALSQLHFREKRFDSTLHYLLLADGQYLPYQDCVNGINAYRSFLSPYFADYYLAVGDSNKAISRLLDFFMNRDGNIELLTKKLKSILLQKWTQEEINKQVQKGIRQMKFTKEDDDHFTVSLTLFGHTIKSPGYGNTQDYEVIYKQHPGIKILQQQ